MQMLKMMLRMKVKMMKMTMRVDDEGGRGSG